MEAKATPNDYYSKIVSPNILFWTATKLLIFEIIASFIMTIFYTKITDAPISFIKEWWYYIPLIIALIICYKKNIKNVILPIAVLFIVVRRVLLFVKVIQLGNISNALTLSLPQLLAWILVFVITLIFSLNIADGAKKIFKTLFFLPFIIFVVAIVMYMKNVGIDLFKIAVSPLDIKGFIWLVLNVLCFVSEALVILMICGCVTETKNHFAIIASILLGVLLLALTIIYSLFIGKNGIKIANTEKVILNNNENKEEETVEKDNKENDSDMSLDNKKFFSGWDNDSYYKDGKKITNDWVEEDNKWYYLKSDSKYAKSEWVDINGDYYYFDSKGAMVSNQWVENKYYVGSDGKMLKNTTTPDGFLVGADGSYVSQNTTINASANVFISNDTTNVGSVANNTSATNGSADTKVAGKFDAGLVSYYHTVNDGKSKEYSEAKFDSDGKLWMYRDIGDNQYGIMIYDSFDKKTYYFFDDDNESYAKDGKTISMAEAERIYTKWDGFSDYYEACMDNE